jgi:O-antigen ligase
MIILAVLFSLSRGGILSMLLVGLCLITLMPFSLKSKLLSLLAFILLTGGYASMLGMDTIISRFDTIGASRGARLDLYISSLPMAADHWLTGIGLGSYTLLSPVYLKGFAEHLHNDRVHSEYLELLIELGIPVASLFFCWLAAGMWNLLRRIMALRSQGESQVAKMIMATAAFCGIIGFLAHGLIDFGWRLPANVFFAMTLLALCTASLESLELTTLDSDTSLEVRDLQDLE